MNVIGQAIVNYVGVHWEEFTAAAGVLFVAGVCTMPQKMPMVRADHPLQEPWTWLRDALQTAVPAARARHEERSSSSTSTPDTTTTHEASASVALDVTPPPQQPVEPAQPQK